MLVVAHDDDGTWKILQRMAEGIQRLHIKVVGWLIQQQQVWPDPNLRSKSKARLLASGESADLLPCKVTKTKTSKEGYEGLVR